MKFGDDLPIRASVLKRDEYRCVACSFDLKCAIATHHVAPRALGGVDDASNLTTLCANCHKVVHWLSVGRRLDGPEAELAQRALGAEAYLKIRTLAGSIRDHAHNTTKEGIRARAGSTDAPMAYENALGVVAHRNKFTDVNLDYLRLVTDAVLQRIPADVLTDCAFRLPRERRFITISIGNIVLFRTPAFPDGANRATNDVWIIWPRNVRISVIAEQDWEDLTVGFAALPCALIDLSFAETTMLAERDWEIFAKACRDAAGVSRARPRPSNVSIHGAHSSEG